MNCNYCGSEMKKCFYTDVISGYKTYIRSVYGENHNGRSRELIGLMMYCPDCGNLQVDLNLEGEK